MKKTSNIVIHSDDIKSTKTFNNLSVIQQKINMNRNSRMRIQNSVNVVLNIGFERWSNQTNASFYHIEIVKELVELKSNN